LQGSPEIYGAATPTKQLHHDYKAKAAAQCGSDSVLDSAAECFTAVAQINVNHTAANTTVSSATLPPGCSVSVDAAGAATAFFNSLATSGASCNSAGNVYAGEATSQIGVTLSVALDKSKGAAAMTRGSKGTYCSENTEGVIAYFNMANVTAAAAEAALAQCEAFSRLATWRAVAPNRWLCPLQQVRGRVPRRRKVQRVLGRLPRRLCRQVPVGLLTGLTPSRKDPFAFCASVGQLCADANSLVRAGALGAPFGGRC
jgi:hypothetical protein